jgi:uncharacterized protein YjbI with pentapeptide repeats
LTDLAGADLEGLDLSGVDLCGADLSRCDLRNANLRNSSLISAKLVEADLSGADLFGADLSGADLSNADLAAANLEKAVLVGVKLNGTRGVNENDPPLTRQTTGPNDPDFGRRSLSASHSRMPVRVRMTKLDKPNILVIWGDDIGIANLSCYTHGLMGHQTPNIDRLAEEGMLFTDSYGEQSCTAGRSSFITGQSVYRTGLSKVGIPGRRSA